VEKLVAFNAILGRPKRLQIRVVEARFLLLDFREIEAGAWALVVDMPARAPVIFPGHSRLPLGFEILFKGIKAASNHFSGMALITLLSSNQPPQSCSQNPFEFECWVILHSVPQI
jgi:hypothetical protein